MTLREAWFSEKLQTIRKKHKDNKWREIKEGCRNCRHAMKKHGYDYVPEDWNFEK